MLTLKLLIFASIIILSKLRLGTAGTDNLATNPPICDPLLFNSLLFNPFSFQLIRSLLPVRYPIPITLRLLN
jgi:hypothetical protein